MKLGFLRSHGRLFSHCRQYIPSASVPYSTSALKVEPPKSNGVTGPKSKSAKVMGCVLQPKDALKTNLVVDIDKFYSLKERPFQLMEVVDPSLFDRKKVELHLRDIPKYYLSLSKARLSSLVVVTAMAGYAMAPVPFVFETFLYCSVGTALTSASANTINQMVEVPYDSKMDRTKNRVLVNEFLSTPHALAFALGTALSGLAILTYGVNELTAVLGGANLFLYTSVYTPLKRQSILNTWVGSVVGAIPPLMGWAAAAGELTSGALVLGGILYAWQFVHFNSLSWNLKKDYARAGYRMMSVSHPDLCRRIALRYSVILFPLCTLAPVLDVTSWTFAFDSIPVNLIMLYLSWRFYKDADAASSRKLFRYSLVHLPALIILMLISKKSLKSTDEEKGKATRLELQKS